MICPKCGQELPEDSLFCQYCGIRIKELSDKEEKTIINNIHEDQEIKPADEITISAENTTSDSSADNSNNNESTVVLTKNAAEKNAVAAQREELKENKPNNLTTSAGKGLRRIADAFKKPSPVLRIIALSVVLLLLVGLNVFQYINGKKLSSEVKELNATISEKDKTISSHKKTISSLNEKVNKLDKEKQELKTKNNFYDNYAVIVGGNGTKQYHKYGCKYLDMSSFRIYNITAAKANGYKSCPYCID